MELAIKLYVNFMYIESSLISLLLPPGTTPGQLTRSIYAWLYIQDNILTVMNIHVVFGGDDHGLHFYDGSTDIACNNISCFDFFKLLIPILIVVSIVLNTKM